MEEFLQMLNLDLLQWVVVISAALLAGFAKTGINGTTMLVIPVLAIVFGGKDSTGILLPMLIVGDLFALWYYHRSAAWRDVIKPLPWALVGLAAGTVVGGNLGDKSFIRLIGVVILVCLGILLYMEKKKTANIPNKPWFYIIFGVMSGFATMIGNAAAPIFSVYLLALGHKKNNYMGVNAWFFFIINLIKLFLQIFVWQNITIRSFSITLIMIPLIAAGAFIGAAVLKKINERTFRWIILGMTSIAAFRLLL